MLTVDIVIDSFQLVRKFVPDRAWALVVVGKDAEGVRWIVREENRESRTGIDRKVKVRVLLTGFTRKNNTYYASGRVTCPPWNPGNRASADKGNQEPVAGESTANTEPLQTTEASDKPCSNTVA